MAAGPEQQLKAEDATKTYRYLGIGIIAIALLAFSIARQARGLSLRDVRKPV
jgi:hypothetical protein